MGRNWCMWRTRMLLLGIKQQLNWTVAVESIATVSEMRGHWEQGAGILDLRDGESNSLGTQFWRAKVFNLKLMLDGTFHMVCYMVRRKVDQDRVFVTSQIKGFYIFKYLLLLIITYRREASLLTEAWHFGIFVFMNSWNSFKGSLFLLSQMRRNVNIFNSEQPWDFFGFWGTFIR